MEAIVPNGVWFAGDRAVNAWRAAPIRDFRFAGYSRKYHLLSY
jgi:hypothetical protein